MPYYIMSWLQMGFSPGALKPDRRGPRVLNPDQSRTTLKTWQYFSMDRTNKIFKILKRSCCLFYSFYLRLGFLYFNRPLSLKCENFCPPFNHVHRVQFNQRMCQSSAVNLIAVYRGEKIKNRIINDYDLNLSGQQDFKA